MTIPHAPHDNHDIPSTASIITLDNGGVHSLADLREKSQFESLENDTQKSESTDWTDEHNLHVERLASADALFQSFDHSRAGRIHSHKQDSREMLEELKNSTNSISEQIPRSSQKSSAKLDTDVGKQKGSPQDHLSRSGGGNEKVLKLSSEKIYELTSSPKSLPLHPAAKNLQALRATIPVLLSSSKGDAVSSETPMRQGLNGHVDRLVSRDKYVGESASRGMYSELLQDSPIPLSARGFSTDARPNSASRTSSTPILRKKPFSGNPTGPTQSPVPEPKVARSIPAPLNLGGAKIPSKPPRHDESMPSPMPTSIPMPPLSIPTYLQLELSSHRPSPLYIHRSITSDFPYESSRVKLERLTNFLLLPPQLEQVLWFGAFACLDAWLYSFTILPLRFFKALWLLVQSWGEVFVIELRFITRFIYNGSSRMWLRQRQKNGARLSQGPSVKHDSTPHASHFQFPTENPSTTHSHPETSYKRFSLTGSKPRRVKSPTSGLMQDDKADIVQGLLIIISCTILMYFDASMMYHSIRGQAAIKLYVIYNVLEVCDRLFSALGQDVLECLLSKETLERKPDGGSKILRPFGLFILALFYNLVHATTLFYQVITLNVAVNSYSNALLTLLMSNQFVEIKSTVFKRFEKENLFQLTCADVVERFQLWLMLTIIASRNIIETGGISLGGGSFAGTSGSTSSAPVRGSSILPKSFTIFPEWTGQVMGPFLLVLGSEMLVDWLKHAYITKFNNTKPAIYGRFLDVLAKDYYSNAFADQNLTRRLGLPVIPLSCLFIRASVQTYHMFLATHMPSPLPSPATSLSVESSSSTSPATTAALQHIDHIFRRALGHSTFGGGNGGPANPRSFYSWLNIFSWTTDDMIALGTMLIFFLVLFLVLLAIKLVLGMCLLSFARGRYRDMKERESVSTHAEGRRVGGWGVVEVDEDKRRWIYDDDPEGLRKLREREAQVKEREREGAGKGFGGVSRYSMVAKRIW